MTAPDFIDTNIILRHLTRDNPDQSERARRLWEAVEAGTTAVETIESVIVEATQVLSSRVTYNLPRSEVARLLVALLRLPGFRLPHKPIMIQAFAIWQLHSQIDFVDALQAAHVERRRAKVITSFDRDFDRVTTIVRAEPS